MNESIQDDASLENMDADMFVWKDRNKKKESNHLGLSLQTQTTDEFRLPI